MAKKIIFVFVLLLGLVKSNAQERALERAEGKYNLYSFDVAIDIYQRVLDKGYVSADLLKKLGNSYYFNAKYPEAAKLYDRLLSEYPEEVSVDYLFRYAQCLKCLGQYDQAEVVFNQFLASNTETQIANRHNRNFLEEIEKNSGRYTLSVFPYNSEYSDFAAAYYEKGLIFSSDRDTGFFARNRHTWTGKDFLDMYVVKSPDSGSIVQKLTGDINTRMHESTSVVTKDGKTMYFTRNNFVDGKRKKDDKGTTRLKLFSAKKMDSIWTDIVELPFNSDAYSVAHPALSPDEKVLYFASDMPGTLGESDIFKVKIVGDGTFGTPENLGNNINTEARETFPFVTESDVLYFASDGHPGLGGLDVFATKIAYNDYSNEVKNVGKPLNSSFDDFALIINEGDTSGYFSSNRDTGMGYDDIYAFTENRPLNFNCEQMVTGVVRDKITNALLAGVTIKVINEQNEEVTDAITNAKGEYEVVIDCNQGNFIRAITNGYMPAEEFLPKSDGKPRTVDFYLEKDQVTAGYGSDLAKLLQLSTIYFDLDKYNIRKDAEVEIQKVITAMEKFPSLKIKVNSHTDSRGKDSYNLWLSQQRAQATVDYMISKGIDASRLLSEGFGEQKITNGCYNGVGCTEKEHERNRRSEFIIYE